MLPRVCCRARERVELADDEEQPADRPRPLRHPAEQQQCRFLHPRDLKPRAVLAHARRERGVRTVLHERGAQMLAALLADGVLDELLLTILPQIEPDPQQPPITELPASRSWPPTACGRPQPPDGPATASRAACGRALSGPLSRLGAASGVPSAPRCPSPTNGRATASAGATVAASIRTRVANARTRAKLGAVFARPGQGNPSA